VTSQNKEKKPSISQLAKEAIKKEHKFPSGTYLIVSTKWKKALSLNYAVIDILGITIYTYDQNRDIKLVKEAFFPWTLWNTVDVDHYFLKSEFYFKGSEPLTFITNENGQDVEAFIKKFTNINVITIKRKWYNKIIGFRSKKKWKMITASFLYLFLLGSCANLFASNDHKELAKQKTETKSETVVNQEDKKTTADNENKTEDDSKATSVVTNNNQEKLQNAQKQQENLARKFHLEAVTVARVIDGDTFELTDGRKVRLIGVNTPESTTRTELYGKEASNYTKSKLEGKQVYLQKDVSETDRYGRLLRIVWLQVPSDDMNEKEIRSKMFNADLVLNGYAEPSTYPPDVKYSDYLVKFAREAREKHKGLWAFGEYGTTKGDLDPKQVSSSTSSSPSPTKNNNSSSNSSSTNNSSAPASSGGNEYFANCTELRKVYPNGVPSNHPAYQPKLDRDKDGYACER
jgi:endonuclease YncB( thermonuclease family)